MNKLQIFFAMLSPIVLLRSASSSDAAKRLYESLMRNYDQRVRPVVNATDVLNVGISLILSQLIDVDEKNQIITSNVWLRHEWRDYRLAWDPERYDNICVMNIPSDQLWLPDIALYNNADGKYNISLMTKAAVYPSGTIVWEPPTIYKSSCPINVQYFPFDEQICPLKLGSWTHHGNQLNLLHIVYPNIPTARNASHFRSQGVFFRDYYPNGEWDIVRAPAVRNQKRYSCCLQPYYDITYELFLRRKTLFYTVHLIIPCVGISLLTFVVFYLPSQSGEKIVLSVSIELALTVIFPLLADLIPSTSTMIPLLGKYLLFIMVLVALSSVKSVMVLSLYHRQTNRFQAMPRWIRYLFIQTLPQYLFLSTKASMKITRKKYRKQIEEISSLSEDETIDSIFLKMLEKCLRLGNLEIIFDRYRSRIKRDQNARDWHRLSFVIDRILLIVFTLISFSGTLIILTKRTSFQTSMVDLTNLNDGVFDACHFKSF